jgi:peptidase A4-like protein
MLPNNLADWPSRADRPAARATRQRRRTYAVVCGLMLVGGLIGLGLFNWLIPVAVRANVSPTAISVAEPAGGAISTSPVPGPTPEDGTPTLLAESVSPTPNIDISGLLGNQTESQNWAGYAATTGGYTAVSAMWTIPDRALNSVPGIDAAWIGVGGIRSRDLIQAGTQQTVSSAGGTRLEAWVEILPRPSDTLPLAIGPGDSIEVSITQQGPETWLIGFANTSSGLSYQLTEHYASSSTSVEWIAEAPSAGRGRSLPLDDFGTISFSHGSAVQDGRKITITEAGAHAITMITPTGQHLVEPSEPGQDGGSFSVTRTSIPSPRRRP